MIKRTLRVSLFALILILVTIFPPVFRATASNPRRSQGQGGTVEEVPIEQLIAEHNLDHAFVGVAVQDLKSGKYLLSYNADRYFIPASNQKLFTTWAALKGLGPDFNYETDCYVEAGTDLGSDDIGSDLLIKGHGSPSFQTEL
ncbi:MAG: D-alanyl-D-alanine carboxypeptidase, partial [Candidatus Bipolaricaulota bacterium]